jgi:WhiB family redox-sensing transcriptional regulator
MTEHFNPGFEHKAACRDEDPEMWYPASTREPVGSPAHEARQICRRCPVRVECARAAADAGRSYGIWAGFRLDGENPEREQLLAFIGPARALTGAGKGAA